VLAVTRVVGVAVDHPLQEDDVRDPRLVVGLSEQKRQNAIESDERHFERQGVSLITR
jgi:hypothetical protein